MGGTFGILAWATIAVSIVALVVGPKPHRRRKWAWIGLASGIAFSISNLYINGHLDSVFDRYPPETEAMGPDGKLVGIAREPDLPPQYPSPAAEAGMSVNACVRDWVDTMERNRLRAAEEAAGKSVSNDDPLVSVSARSQMLIQRPCEYDWRDLYSTEGDLLAQDAYIEALELYLDSSIPIDREMALSVSYSECITLLAYDTPEQMKNVLLHILANPMMDKDAVLWNIDARSRYLCPLARITVRPVLEDSDVIAAS